MGTDENVGQLGLYSSLGEIQGFSFEPVMMPDNRVQILLFIAHFPVSSSFSLLSFFPFSAHHLFKPHFSSEIRAEKLKRSDEVKE